MACRKTYKANTNEKAAETTLPAAEACPVKEAAPRLLFGVDSMIQANDHLQNNLEHFEWIVRNKIYPNFCGRNLVGENSLTKEEIRYLHGKGCKIAAVYPSDDEKLTAPQGEILARKAVVRAMELGIPKKTAIFLEISEKEEVTSEFMCDFAKELMKEGYTPAFKANTDAKYSFDKAFSRGLQIFKEQFEKCLIWAVSPTAPGYDGIRTSHLIHPDVWMPFAPSGITRNEIAVWQYGCKCHPIEDDMGKEVTFNMDLVRNEQIIIEKMF